MIANAQLDNDKAAYTYQIELLKDRLEDLEQDFIQLQREHKEKCREHEHLKRAAAKLKEDLKWVKTELAERDMLIAEKGLVIVVCDENGVLDDTSSDDICGDYNNHSVHNENGSGDANNTENNSSFSNKLPRKALVSAENAELLESAGEGSLGKFFKFQILFYTYSF